LSRLYAGWHKEKKVRAFKPNSPKHALKERELLWRNRPAMPSHLRQQLDTASILIIALTLLLFLAALFTKAFTHDLLLEAGVFLVSVKLIMMAYKQSVTARDVKEKLDQIHGLLTAKAPNTK
jgi:hypothetical protein